MDTEIFNQNITGLGAAIANLRLAERTHIKINTLTEQVEKARSEAGKMDTELDKIKADRKALQQKKTLLIAKTCDALAKAVTKLLPEGECLLSFHKDKFRLGWDRKGNVTPYLGLSGGEKALFDIPFAAALLGDAKNKIVLCELAEAGDEHVRAFIEQVAKSTPNIQILAATVHNPYSGKAEAPDSWTTLNSRRVA